MSPIIIDAEKSDTSLVTLNELVFNENTQELFFICSADLVGQNYNYSDKNTTHKKKKKKRGIAKIIQASHCIHS